MRPADSGGRLTPERPLGRTIAFEEAQQSTNAEISGGAGSISKSGVLGQGLYT